MPVLLAPFRTRIHLAMIGRTTPSEFWWCHSGERQSHYHLQAAGS